MEGTGGDRNPRYLLAFQPKPLVSELGRSGLIIRRSQVQVLPGPLEKPWSGASSDASRSSGFATSSGFVRRLSV